MESQVDRGIGKERLIVVKHAIAGETGLIAGDQLGKDNTRNRGHFERATGSRARWLLIWRAILADLGHEINHYR